MEGPFKKVVATAATVATLSGAPAAAGEGATPNHEQGGTEQVETNEAREMIPGLARVWAEDFAKKIPGGTQEEYTQILEAFLPTLQELTWYFEYLHSAENTQDATEKKAYNMLADHTLVGILKKCEEKINTVKTGAQ